MCEGRRLELPMSTSFSGTSVPTQIMSIVRELLLPKVPKAALYGLVLAIICMPMSAMIR